MAIIGRKIVARYGMGSLVILDNQEVILLESFSHK